MYVIGNIPVEVAICLLTSTKRTEVVNLSLDSLFSGHFIPSPVLTTRVTTKREIISKGDCSVSAIQRAVDATLALQRERGESLAG